MSVLEIARVDRLERSWNLTPLFPELDLTSATASLALLPVNTKPTAATVWTSATLATGSVTVLLAGPDADSAGALVVPATADLWVKVSAAPEVDAAKLGRITVPGGGSVASLPAVYVASVAGLTGAPTAQSLVDALDVPLRAALGSALGEPTSTTFAGARGAFRVLVSFLELLPFWTTGHSWQASTGNATSGARWYERLVSRLRLGAVTNKAVSGRTIGDIANLTLGGGHAWTPRTKSLVGLCCLINDLTLLGDTTASRAGFTHAWRALLSRITANGVSAANSATFAYSPSGWTAVTVAQVADGTTATQAATASSTGGTRWRTTTVGGYVDGAFPGDACDLVFVARAAGAGLITVTNGGTTLGTLDLTAATGQDTPAIFRVRGLGAGAHTVRATLTSGASMTVDSLNIPSSAPTTGVVLAEGDCVGGILPGGSISSSYVAAQSVFRGLLSAVVAEFPTFSYIDLQARGWDAATMLFDDGKHPNDKGCAFIAGEVEAVLATRSFSNGINVLTAAAYPAVYTAASASIPYGGQDGTASGGLLATPANLSMALNWSRLAAPAGVTDYSIQYRTSPAGAWTDWAHTASTATSATVTGLTNGTAYDFQVAPIVGGVTGTYSRAVTATPNLSYATDTFTRADGTGLSATETGALAWSIIDSATGASWGISSNQAAPLAGGNSLAVVDAAQADVKVRATLSAVPGNYIGGIAGRAASWSDCIYVSLRQTSAIFTYTLIKRVAGVSTNVLTTAATPVNGDVVDLVMSGTSVSLVVNGTTLGTVTITEGATNTKHGLYGNFTGTPSLRLDNFSLTAP